MRIATRLWLALVVAIVLVLGGGMIGRVRQEQDLLLEVTLRDRRFFANALHAQVEGRADPLAEANRMLGREEVADAHIEATLVSLIGARGLPRPILPETDTGALAAGAVVVTVHGDEILTYVPLGSPDRLAIELSEPRAMNAILARIGFRTVTMQTALLIAIAALITFALVRWLVGAPLERLVLLARRIGSGDLAARAMVTGRGEVAELTGEMNQMAEKLETTRRALEEADAARLEAMEQLRHADRLRTVGQLASALAHELGTPLNVVAGHARNIEGDVAGEPLASARTILEQTARMTRIIRNVLDYSRRKGPQRSVRHLEDLARHAVETLAPLARRHRVVVDVEADGDVELQVDPDQILQVLTNLIMNGMQAMPDGGRVRVLVTRADATPPEGIPEQPGAYAKLSVVDEGTGIEPEDLPHLFEPFYTRKSADEGTGLGLAVVEGIVRDHHGWVQASSEVARGSRFDVYLPLVGR